MKGFTLVLVFCSFLLAHMYSVSHAFLGGEDSIEPTNHGLTSSGNETSMETASRELTGNEASMEAVSGELFSPGNDELIEAASIDLIRIVSMGYVPGIKKLLQNGECDVNYINEDGDTPLSVAARRNDLKAMRILIEHGADPTIGVGVNYLLEVARVYQNQDMSSLLTNGFGSTSSEEK